jgi:hypothetical protein
MMIPQLFLLGVAVAAGWWWVPAGYLVILVLAGTVVARERKLNDNTRGSRRVRGHPPATVWFDERDLQASFDHAGVGARFLVLRRQVTVPLDRIVDVRVDSEISARHPGFPAPYIAWVTPTRGVGAFLPPAGPQLKAWYVVRRGAPALVIDLRTDNYQRLVLDVADPESTAREVRDAARRAGAQLH